MTRSSPCLTLGLTLAALGILGCTPEPSAAEVLVDTVYHRSNWDVAINLVVRADGEFEFRHDDCANTRITLGQWTFEGDTILVRPANNNTSMTWIHEGGLVSNGVKSVVLSSADGGKTIDLHGELRDDSGFTDSFDEVWKDGGVCMQCEAGLGPTSCDDPFAE